MQGDGLPQPRGARPVLVAVPQQILLRPPGRVVHALPALQAMHVQDHIQPRVFRHFHGAVEPHKRVVLQMQRLGVVLQQAVMKRQAHDVEPERPDDFEVAFRDPVLAVHLHQPVLLVDPEPLAEDRLELVLVAHALDVEHPHLQQKPVAQVAALQHDGPAIRADNSRALGAQKGKRPGLRRRLFRNRRFFRRHRLLNRLFLHNRLLAFLDNGPLRFLGDLDRAGRRHQHRRQNNTLFPTEPHDSPFACRPPAGPDFPIIGKMPAVFSNDWKKPFPMYPIFGKMFMP